MPSDTVNATFFLCQDYSKDSTRTGERGAQSASLQVKSIRFVPAPKPVSSRTAA